MSKPSKYKHKEIVFTDHALQRIEERKITHMRSLDYFYQAKPVQYFPKKYATMLKNKDYVYIAVITKTTVSIVTCYREDPNYHAVSNNLPEGEGLYIDGNS